MQQERLQAEYRDYTWITNYGTKYMVVVLQGIPQTQ